MLVRYQENAWTKGFAVKMKESAKHSLNFCEDLNCNTAGPSHLTSNDCSTPSKVHGCRKSLPSSTLSSSSTVPISPIPVAHNVTAQPSTSSAHVAEPVAPADAPAVTETIVVVEVQWQSNTKRRFLPADFCSLGKMLCRGTLTQIARAAWQNDKLTGQLVCYF